MSNCLSMRGARAHVCVHLMCVDAGNDDCIGFPFNFFDVAHFPMCPKHEHQAVQNHSSIWRNEISWLLQNEITVRNAYLNGQIHFGQKKWRIFSAREGQGRPLKYISIIIIRFCRFWHFWLVWTSTSHSCTCVYALWKLKVTTLIVMNLWSSS